MIPPGFFGSRADLLTDFALSLFILLPLVMPLGFRLAQKRRLALHRTVQAAFLATMTVAVAALELDIRIKGGTGALGGSAVSTPRPLVRALLLVHLLIAVTTWVAWSWLVLRSWGRFGSTLPGGFSLAHRRWGRRIWLGVGATAATGTLLYLSVFVL